MRGDVEFIGMTLRKRKHFSQGLLGSLTDILGKGNLMPHDPQGLEGGLECDHLHILAELACLVEFLRARTRLRSKTPTHRSASHIAPCRWC